MAEFRGGDKFEARLREIAEQVGEGGVLRVGFLENATYPDGTPVAMIGMIQNFGAPGAGIPPRPFFTNFIAFNQEGWPAGIATQLQATGYDVEATLTITGAVLVGQLKQSIHDTNDPPLAPSTIRRKGFAKPLIDTAHMLNSVDSEVEMT